MAARDDIADCHGAAEDTSRRQVSPDDQLVKPVGVSLSRPNFDQLL